MSPVLPASLVLDASLALSWCFEDKNVAADRLLDLVVEHGAVVPAIWRLEVANALQMAVRQGRIAAAYRDRALAELALLPIRVDAETDTYAWSTSLRLAERLALPLHAAAYLELAQRRSLKLATLDAALRQAAGALGLELAA